MPNKTKAKLKIDKTQKVKTALALALIFCVCAGLFTWAAYTFLPTAADISQREIVNDDYAVLTAPMQAGDVLKQSLQVQGRLYGVVLNVATFNRTARGTVRLALLNSEGAQIAINETDMSVLKDNTFHRFLFEEMVDAKAGENYILQIQTSPASAEDSIAFWQSEGKAQDFIEEKEEKPHYSLENFKLTINEVAQSGTLALQYTVQYAGSFIYKAYAFFAVLLTLFFMALFWLLVLRKTALYKVFVLCALVLGSVFVFLTPLRTAPDEYVHIAVSYRNANKILGVAEQGDAASVTVRAGDTMKLHRYDYSATNIFAYQDVYEGLFAPAPKGEYAVIQAPGLLQFPLVYLPQTIGMVIARLLGLGQVGLLVFGRFANLVFYTVLVSFAIKRMPIAKPMLFCVALLPMSLQLAASFSYDTYVLAISFFFIAYCLWCALDLEKLGIKQFIALAALFVLLVPAKSLYILLFAMVGIIPLNKYLKFKKPLPKKKIIIIAALAGAVLMLVFVLLNFSSLRMAAGSAGTPEAHLVMYENGDAAQYYSIAYVFLHIPQTIELVLRTLWEQPPLWLQGILGTRLGEIIAINIEVNWIVGIGMVFVLFMASLPAPEDERVLANSRRIGLIAIAGALFFALLAVAVTWTPINYTTVFGMQGRYILPFLPLVLLAVRGKALRFDKKVQNMLCFAMPALCMLSQLEGFLEILQK